MKVRCKMTTKLILVGRCGSGKTSVAETLTGSRQLNEKVHLMRRFGSSLEIFETLGFFSKDHNEQSCTQNIAEVVESFSPGSDAFGFVIRIGRFTPEEKKMIKMFRETLGEKAFRSTILIFTHLDDLLFDNVTLEEFLQDSPQELQDLIDRCGRRYVGFNNRGSQVDKEIFAKSLIEMIKSMQQNNQHAVYTVEMSREDSAEKRANDEQERKMKEETYQQMKEQMKRDIRRRLENGTKKEKEEKVTCGENGLKGQGKNGTATEKKDGELKVILVGRCGAGKTSVMESLMGHQRQGQDTQLAFQRFCFQFKILETPGFFSPGVSVEASTIQLSNSVKAMSGGPDVFGLVIRADRFTTEEKKMTEIFRQTFGKDVFRFTILIFTRLDNLIYDNISLSEFVEDSPQDIKDILDLCGGRYVGFDNTGTWISRDRYSRTLVDMMTSLQRQNRYTPYTVDMLREAMVQQNTKRTEDLQKEREGVLLKKEKLKEEMRPELKKQIERELELKKKEQEPDHPSHEGAIPKVIKKHTPEVKQGTQIKPTSWQSDKSSTPATGSKRTPIVYSRQKTAIQNKHDDGGVTHNFLLRLLKGKGKKPMVPPKPARLQSKKKNINPKKTTDIKHDHKETEDSDYWRPRQKKTK